MATVWRECKAGIEAHYATRLNDYGECEVCERRIKNNAQAFGLDEWKMQAIVAGTIDAIEGNEQ